MSEPVSSVSAAQSEVEATPDKWSRAPQRSATDERAHGSGSRFPPEPTRIERVPTAAHSHQYSGRGTRNTGS